MANTGYYNEEKTMYGNYGALFLNDSQVEECTALQAKAKVNKVEVPMCGTNAKKYKIVGFDGSGTMTLNKTSSRFILLAADNLRNGKDTPFTLISKLSDPGNGYTERIKFTNCKLDELTLADWGTGKLGTESVPFTFEDFEPLDTIDPDTVTPSTTTT